MKKLSYLLLLIIIATFWSCEDPIPEDGYIPENIVEAFLIVDEPIKNITIIKSQPITVKFNYYDALNGDLQVTIKTEDRVFPLSYRSPAEDSTDFGYYFDDQSYLVESGVEYELEIIEEDGNIMTGSTITPPRSDWVREPKDFLQYPQDTLDMPSPDSLRISWEGVDGYFFYPVSISCLDTLEYGRYLDPPTDEKNSRAFRPFGNSERRYREKTGWGFAPATELPIFWTTFKWHGLQEISVYVPDDNFLRWTLQNITREVHEPLLNSIKNGKGVFGSASVIKDTVFVLKRKNN